jgi:fructose-specific component phosphotransferase system IIB-like protein
VKGILLKLIFLSLTPKVNEKLIVDYFTTAPGADFMIYKDTSSINNDSILKGKFYWITNASHSGNEYYLTLNARDNFCPINNFDSRTFSLFVKSKPDSFQYQNRLRIVPI